MEFDANCISSEAQNFYEGLRPLIKLQINENGQELLACDDLVKKLLRANRKVKIKNKWDLD